MTDVDPELSATLDAEYREFVRSLHKDTIATIVATEIWFFTDCFRLAAVGGYTAGDENGKDSKTVADRAEDEWRREIHPRLMTLIHGHPDPDVREAADFLDTRLWSAILIISRPTRIDEPEDDRSPPVPRLARSERSSRFSTRWKPGPRPKIGVRRSWGIADDSDTKRPVSLGGSGACARRDRG